MSWSRISDFIAKPFTDDTMHDILSVLSTGLTVKEHFCQLSDCQPEYSNNQSRPIMTPEQSCYDTSNQYPEEKEDQP